MAGDDLNCCPGAVVGLVGLGSHAKIRRKSRKIYQAELDNMAAYRRLHMGYTCCPCMCTCKYIYIYIDGMHKESVVYVYIDACIIYAISFLAVAVEAVAVSAAVFIRLGGGGGGGGGGGECVVFIETDTFILAIPTTTASSIANNVP